MEPDQLEQAIAALEAQRDVLGDVVVDAAVVSLREKLSADNRSSGEAFVKPGGIRVEPNLPLTGAIASTPTDAVTRSPSSSLPGTTTGERRVVTILFCDVKGSTAMAEKLDPEEWARVIKPALKQLIEPVRRHGGTVAQVMGDGILAFFGAPLAHEDDPQRAVLAGLEILDEIRVYHEQMKRERKLDFNVRVGIHTGLAVVGEVGAGQQVEYTAIGDTVNLAARMEQTARPGTVQISALTHRFVKQGFEIEPLGEIQVKGKREPVQTYRVIRLKEQPGSQRGLERQGLQSPLVGREEELRAAVGCVQRLLTGQGGVLSILGEAGIGKSRLIAEIYRDIPEGRIYWLEGHTLSYGQTISYWPFQEILRCYADISANDSEDQAWRKLEGKIRTLFPDHPEKTDSNHQPQPSPTTAEILPYLASLLKLKLKDEYAERVKYLEGEALGKQIFLAARRFFEQLARDHPLVLVFEDLHWIDDSSVSLLEHLLPLVESAPLLIICLSRPYQETPAAHLGEVLVKDHAGRYVEIELTPLSQGNSNRLVHNLLEIENLPPQLREMIVRKAEGNPFFLEEILRALIDLGAIKRNRANRRWRATTQIDTLAIPDTVQGVILARIDRLEDGVKEVLRLASVIGRSFLYRVLRTIAEAGELLDARLAELQAIELIQEKQRLPELEYLFKHALAQEATYESILLQTRRDLHRQVGQAIEMLFADRLKEFYGLLAYHYARAEAWEKAQLYLFKAADQAGRMAADAEALEHYRQAKAAYAHAFGDHWDPVQQAELERKIGEAFFRRGEIKRSLETYHQALAYLGRPLPKARGAVHLLFLKEIAEQVERSLLPGLFRKRRNEPTPQRQAAVEEELRIYQAIEFMGGAGDPEIFLLLAFRMLNFSERNSLPAGIVMGSAGLGVLFYYVNFPRFARHYLNRAVRFNEQLQRPDTLGLAPTILMLMEAYRGNWEAAFEIGQRASETYQETGNLGAWAVSISVTAHLCILQGDFTRALAYGHELAQFGEEAGDRMMWGDALGAQGFAEQRLGRLEEALLHLQQAIEITEAAGNIYFRLLVGNDLGQCYLRRGDWQAALDTLETNRLWIVKYHFSRDPDANAMLRNSFAWAYLLAAEQSPSPSVKAAWLKKARQACRSALKWGKAFPLGKPEALRLQGRCEWLEGNKAEAQRWWSQSLAEAETLGMRYELGLAHLEIGQRQGQLTPQETNDHLTQAEAIFSEVGAQLDLAQVRSRIAAPAG